jgi:branched-chain amino acid transport system ATP-binding protein
MLKVEHVSVWYGPTEVLRDVSFEIPVGAIVALLGGNGAGKSTTLNMLSGLLKPRSGTVVFDGKRLDGLHPHDIVVRGVAQVPQGRYVWPAMTVHDNIVLGAITRKDKAGIRSDMEEMFSMFPMLAERQATKAGQLSGGQQQMLAIARALMCRPRLLLMDEPSHGLSPKIVEEMIATIRRLHESGITILLVEQNVGVAAALASVAHVLRNGAISLTSPGRELMGNPDLLRSYLGR